MSSLYLLGSTDGRKNTMGRGGMVKRLRRYSDNGYSTSIAGQHTDKWDGNGVSKTMISLTASKTTINKKYNKGG